jgi:hypothetical protein
MVEAAELNEFDREEWWDVCRTVKPDMTREQFEADWEEFQELKRKKGLQ